MEVTEILSSDEEMEVDGGITLEEESFRRDLSYEPEDNHEINLPQGPTDWQDPNITSQVIHEGKTIQVTHQLKVERIELLNNVPSVWPVPRVPTAYIINLCRPEFAIVEHRKVLTPDGLVKNKACCSWFVCVRGKLT